MLLVYHIQNAIMLHYPLSIAMLIKGPASCVHVLSQDSSSLVKCGYLTIAHLDSFFLTCDMTMGAT